MESASGSSGIDARWRVRVYLAITALTAAGGLIVEIVAGRMVAPYIGMSLYTWTAIIAVVLAGFSVGHWIGGKIAEWPNDTARHGVAWSLILAALTAILSLVLIRLLSEPIIALGLAVVPTILILTSALFLLPSLFVGIASPALTKLAIDESDRPLGSVLGAFFAAGAAGSIIGTLAAGYLFISWLGSIRTILIVATAYAVMGLILFAMGRPRAGLKPAALVVPIVVSALLAAPLFVAGQRVLAFTGPCHVESDYYCIRVDDLTDQLGQVSRVMVLDHLAHGINVRDDPLLLVSPYLEMQDFLARIHSGNRSPFEVAFVGGGAGTLPRAWHAARPDAEITIAEIDPAVTEMAHGEMWLPRDERLDLIAEDGRRLLRRLPEGAFDIIVGDAFHDITVPQHLVTLEFFSLVQSRLRPDGIYLMNVIDDADRPRLALSVVETLKQVFPTVEIWRSNEPQSRKTYVVAGLRQATPYEELPSRVQPGIVFTRHDTDARAALDPIVLTDDYAPVDRLIGVE